MREGLKQERCRGASKGLDACGDMCNWRVGHSFRRCSDGMTNGLIVAMISPMLYDHVARSCGNEMQQGVDDSGTVQCSA
jgi:hypothetical protein